MYSTAQYITALEVKKMDVLRIVDAQERNRIWELNLGMFMYVAYREISFSVLRCVMRITTFTRLTTDGLNRKAYERPTWKPSPCPSVPASESHDF